MMHCKSKQEWFVATVTCKHLKYCCIVRWCVVDQKRNGLLQLSHARIWNPNAQADDALLIETGMVCCNCHMQKLASLTHSWMMCCCSKQAWFVATVTCKHSKHWCMARWCVVDWNRCGWLPLSHAKNRNTETQLDDALWIKNSVVCCSCHMQKFETTTHS